MAEPLSAEEEAHLRQCSSLGGEDLRRVWATLDAARVEVARLQSLVDSHEAVLRALHERVEREARWAAERPEDD